MNFGAKKKAEPLILYRICRGLAYFPACTILSTANENQFVLSRHDAKFINPYKKNDEGTVPRKGFLWNSQIVVWT